MYCYHFREWLIFFYFYCVCGWIFESTYVSLRKKAFINRGFMHGPWLPLYGTGAILVLWITLPFHAQPLLVYFVGMIGATVLEYFTGAAMVKLFRVRYWDYSDQKIQLHGHICLTSSIAWGFLSLAMVYLIHKPVERFIFSLNEEVVSVFAFVVTVGMVYDFSVALRKALDIRDLILQAEAARKELEQHLEEKQRLMEAVSTFVKASIDEDMAERKEQIANRIEQRKETLEKILDDLENKSRKIIRHNPGAKLLTPMEHPLYMKERFFHAINQEKNEEN